MEELAQWLKTQHKGLRTYKTFQRKVLELSARNKNNYALYSLLGVLVDRFVETYDERPLTLDITDEAHKRLAAITDKAMHYDSMPAEERVALLNEIAAADLA